MKLLLRRDQRSGMLGGKPVFSIDVRAEISDGDRAAIKKYKLGETELYSSHILENRGSGLLGAASRFAYKAIMTTVSVKDLEGGKHIECKDIVEMLAVEDQLKEAARTFRAVLDAAKHFGGEEVVEL